MGTNIAEMFREVSKGRLLTQTGFAWACPECGVLLAVSRCRESRDRSALAHCLLHGRSTRRLVGDPEKTIENGPDLFERQL